MGNGERIELVKKFDEGGVESLPLKIYYFNYFRCGSLAL